MLGCYVSRLTLHACHDSNVPSLFHQGLLGVLCAMVKLLLPVAKLHLRWQFTKAQF